MDPCREGHRGWMVFWWTGPIGIGVFLVSLAAMIHLLAKADAVSRTTRAGLGQRDGHSG